ncbi:MAG: rplY [Candidatus Magasanikbacteria bacterium]|nr:rplY [Candidatus Magasanikbacteria bacterium]
MNLSLTALNRTTSRTEKKKLRLEKKIPAVLYGPNIKPETLAVAAIDFMRTYKAAGESTLVDLVRGTEAPLKVLIQDIDRHPVTGEIIHVDFRQIPLDRKMRATVGISFVGEAAAVKELGGTLVKARDEVEVECLPKDLVHEIKVDLSVLKTFDDVIRIKDLVLSAGVAILEDMNEALAKVTAPLTEEQLKAMEATGPADVSKIEVAGKKKEEEAAEGEVGAGETGAAKGEKGEMQKEEKKEKKEKK